MILRILSVLVLVAVLVFDLKKDAWCLLKKNFVLLYLSFLV